MTEASALYRLMAWLSPSFPVGAYAYSQGIEWAVECGAITDRESLKGWIESVLRAGSGRSDGALFAAAHRAATAGDRARLSEVAALAAALVPSAERRLETLQQGAAFALAVRASWPAADLDTLYDAVAPLPLAYPVAVAIAAAAHGIGLEPALAAFLQALAANLVSAGLRLVPLGQTDGQRAIVALESAIAATAASAPDIALDDIGGACLLADIASMRHETQHTRLFRS